MVEIKPDEISAILRQQLSNFNVGASLEEVGTVLQIGDGIARIYGLNLKTHLQDNHCRLKMFWNLIKKKTFKK